MGGGKTEALLAMPLRWAHHPQHRAIILRRERKLLQEIIDRARVLYRDVFNADLWHETELRFKLPTGAFIHFGYAENEKDIEKFKTFEFNLVCFDELTEFTEYQYSFMLTRNRAKAADLPLMLRTATNPGGEGMAWVDKRFIGVQPDGSELYVPYKVYEHSVRIEGMEDLSLTRQRIPSTVFDNPRLPNRMEYIAGLGDMSPEDQEAYLYGRWHKFKGQFFPKMPKFVDPVIKFPDYYVVRCADYGWTDPTAILWLIVYPKSGVVEVAAEVYQSKMTTGTIADVIQMTEKQLGIHPSKVLQSVLSPDACERGTSEGGPTIQQLLMARQHPLQQGQQRPRQRLAPYRTTDRDRAIACVDGALPKPHAHVTKAAA